MTTKKISFHIILNIKHSITISAVAAAAAVASAEAAAAVAATTAQNQLGCCHKANFMYNAY